jgi:hypothetical protein
MISEVDDALRALVRDALEATEVEVVFDAPTKDWAARRNAPTVSLYLYDLREDLRRRERGFHLQRLADGAPGSRVPPPRHFRLSYLVTAWTQRPEDEHRILDSVLRCFLRHEALPSELVAGALAEPRLPVPLFVGLPPPEDRGFADVWSALGGELKPSLDVVVVAPTLTGVAVSVGPPASGGLTLDVSDRSGAGSDVGRVRHRPPEPPAPAGTPTPAADGGPPAHGGRAAAPRARRRR